VVELTNSFTFTLRPKPPYNFNLTIRKPTGWDLFTPDEKFSDDSLWTALYVETTLFGLKIKSKGTTSSPRILVTAYSKRRLTQSQKATVKQTVASKPGVDDDVNEFYSACKNGRILSHAIEDLYGMHDTQGGSLFDSAILAICLQMAPLKRSNQMMNCILRRYGEIASFEVKAVQMWPLPDVIAGLKIPEFTRQCKLGFRAKYLVKLAKALTGGTFPSIEDLSRLPSDAAKARLLELPGIGDYSADIINPLGGFPIDVWSAEVFGKSFPREMIAKVKEEGIKRWGRWSWMAFFYIVNDLENLSKALRIKLRLA